MRVEKEGDILGANDDFICMQHPVSSMWRPSTAISATMGPRSGERKEVEDGAFFRRVEDGARWARPVLAGYAMFVAGPN